MATLKSGKATSEFWLTVASNAVVVAIATVALFMDRLDSAVWAAIALGLPAVTGSAYTISRGLAKRSNGASGGDTT